jgi:hypothetical protein
MDDIAKKILMLCSDFQAQGYVFITLCMIVIGIGLAASEESMEKTKKRIPYIIIGWIILMGALTLGATYGAKLKF